MTKQYIDKVRGIVVWVSTRVLQMIRRFINNTPRNDYESILFMGIRTAASRFGQGRIFTP